ncbi:hypothetical protein IWQ54_004802 [Labrenzia sp. EL_195]|nr:hypothetical protein [Labrenzia sp. EL_195]
MPAFLTQQPKKPTVRSRPRCGHSCVSQQTSAPLPARKMCVSQVSPFLRVLFHMACDRVLKNQEEPGTDGRALFMEGVNEIAYANWRGLLRTKCPSSIGLSIEKANRYTRRSNPEKETHGHATSRNTLVR